MGHLLPKPVRALPESEQKRLVADATRPLSRQEQDRLLENTFNLGKLPDLRAVASEIADARIRFCHDAVAAQVGKGTIPAWVGLKGRGAESREWLRREGFHFVTYRDNPYRMDFCKGDQTLARMQIHLKGEMKA